MAEIVLGTGKQTSIPHLLEIIEAQLQRTKGHPRRVEAKSTHVALCGERAGFEGPFNAFEVRLKDGFENLDEVLAVAREHAAGCALTEEDGWHVLTCPPTDSSDTEAALAAVEAIASAFELPEVWRVAGGNYRIDHISSELLFKALVQYKASDVHLSSGLSPIFRIDNQTRTSEILEPLSAEQILALVREMATDAEWEEYMTDHQTSFSFHQVGIGYARVSAFFKFGSPHLTLRFLPEKIPSFDELNIPKMTMEKLAALHRGLLLVTGMTGSGKTTTVAALVDWINRNRALHILTIENPVEYVHKNRKSVVSQRTLGTDVNSFYDAVTGALRHDPDVILIGEMRDPDTIRAAINAAATGHLVVSTLHANTASEVINRIVSFFDPVERDLVKLQLRDCLQCVICQRLVPRVGGGRIPALELMFNDIKPIRDAVIMGDTDAMRIGIQQTTTHSFLFENYLHDLCNQGKIDMAHAMEYATEVSILEQMMMGTYSVPRLEGLKAARDASQRSK